MKYLVLTILAIMAIMLPTTGAMAVDSFWTNSATVTVTDPIEVYSDAGCTHLVATGLPPFPVTAKLGDSRTLQLWVKNTSTSADFTVTPAVVYDATAFTVTGATPIAVNRSTVGSFTFVVTAIKAGSYTVTLNLSHN